MKVCNILTILLVQYIMMSSVSAGWQPGKLWAFMYPKYPIVKKWMRLTCQFDFLQNPEFVQILNSNGEAFGGYHIRVNRTDIGFKYTRAGRFVLGVVEDVKLYKEKTVLTLVVAIRDACRDFNPICVVRKNDRQYQRHIGEGEGFAEAVPTITFNGHVIKGKTIPSKYISTSQSGNIIMCSELKSTAFSKSMRYLMAITMSVWINGNNYNASATGNNKRDNRCYNNAVISKTYNNIAASDKVVVLCTSKYRYEEFNNIYASTIGATLPKGFDKLDEPVLSNAGSKFLT